MKGKYFEYFGLTSTGKSTIINKLAEVPDEKRIWLKFCIFHLTFPAVHDTSCGTFRTGLQLTSSLTSTLTLDHPRICIKLRHLIRKLVKSRSLTTWMNFYARLPPSRPMTLPTFFSTHGTDVDSSVTVSFTMAKYIANRLIRLSIRIELDEYSPSPIAHPFNFFNSISIFLTI